MKNDFNQGNKRKEWWNMYCSKCGKEVKDGVKFCPYCGANCNDTAETEVDYNTQENSSNNSSKSVKHNKQNKKGKKTGIIIGVIALFLVLGIVGFVIFGQPVKGYLKDIDKYIETGEYDKAIEVLSDVPDKLKDNKKITTRIEKDQNKTYLRDQNGKCRYVVCEHTKWIYDENENLMEVMAKTEDDYEVILESENTKEAGVIFKTKDWYKEWDKNRNLIKQIYYNEEGNARSWDEYEYDKNGNIIKQTKYNKDGEAYEYSEYEYDKNGNKIKDTTYDEDGEAYEYSEYEYDKNGNKIKEIAYNEEADIYCKYEFECDKNGNIINDMRYDENGSQLCHYGYKYDKNGNLRNLLSYDEEENVIYHEEYKYDKNGNNTEFLAKDEEGNIEYHYFFEYDKNKNMINILEYDEDENEILQLECLYEYDANGNVIRETLYDKEEGNVIYNEEYEYEYGLDIKYIQYNYQQATYMLKYVVENGEIDFFDSDIKHKLLNRLW